VQSTCHAVAAEEMKHLREAQHIEGPLKWHGYSLPEPAAPFVFSRDTATSPSGGIS
jgi:rubrerythrin